VLELAKPWVDLNRYVRDRLRETLYEAELAERFLENGLIRNAADKAFQAAKALLAALAAVKRDELAKIYVGSKRINPRKVVARVDWVIAMMPTARMKEVAAYIGDRELELVVEKALDLHQFQYNGIDREGEYSRYPSTRLVERDIRDVVDYVKKAANSLMGKANLHEG